MRIVLEEINSPVKIVARFCFPVVLLLFNYSLLILNSVSFLFFFKLLHETVLLD